MAKKSTFWKDFKAFITRGSVVDMAVAVVIGSAFGKIVTGLVNYILNPFIGLFMKEGSLDSVRTVIREAVYAEDGVTVVTDEVAILWGTWIQTIIDFIIVALCIFLILRIITKAKNAIEAEKLAAEAKKAEEDKKAADEAAAALAAKQAKLEENQFKQAELLQEICDLLKAKQ